jgi:hypothetical protein
MEPCRRATCYYIIIVGRRKKATRGYKTDYNTLTEPPAQRKRHMTKTTAEEAQGKIED